MFPLNFSISLERGVSVMLSTPAGKTINKAPPASEVEKFCLKREMKLKHYSTKRVLDIDAG